MAEVRLMKQTALEEVTENITSDERITKYMDPKLVKGYEDFRKEYYDTLEDLYLGMSPASKDANKIGSSLFSYVGANLQNIMYPSKEFLNNHLDAANQALAKGDITEQEFKSIVEDNKFLQGLGDTAWVAPTKRADGDLGFTYAFSQDLHEDFKKAFGDDKKSYTEALSAVLYHEILGHISAGDVEPEGFNEEGKYISQQGYNIIYDARINSMGMFGHKDPFSFLKEAIPGMVHGETLKQHLGVQYELINLAGTLGQKGEKLTSDHIAQHMVDKGLVKKENVNKFLKQFEGIDLEKFQDNVTENWEDINKNVRNAYKQEIEKYSLKPKISVSSVGIDNILDLISDSFSSFEERKSPEFLYDTLLKSYDEVSKYLPSRPGKGKGRGKGKPGEGGEGTLEGNTTPDNDKYTEEMDSDDYKAQNDDFKDSADEASSEIDQDNRSRGKGTSEVSKELKYDPNKAMKDNIINILNELDNHLLTTKKVVRRFLPIVPPALAEALEAERGAPLPVMPLGFPAPKVEKKPFDGFVFAIIDQSGSVPDAALAKSKSSLAEAYLLSNVAMIEFGVADNAENASIRVLDPRKEFKPQDILIRDQESSIDDFHKIAYEFDELLKHEPFKKQIDNACEKLGISKEELLEAWRNGRVKSIVITDGHVDTARSKPEYFDLASKFSHGVRPITYISTSNNNFRPLDNQSLYNIRYVPYE